MAVVCCAVGTTFVTEVAMVWLEPNATGAGLLPQMVTVLPLAVAIHDALASTTPARLVATVEAAIANGTLA